MIDKLSLTIYRPPDMNFLELNGDITESLRDKLYKYICDLGKCVVFYRPHKFSDEVNFGIPYTKIDINPKKFDCYDHIESYVFSIFRHHDNECNIRPEDFNVSRIDIAVDIENFPIDILLSTLRVKRIRPESLSFYKGTIYAGSDPKIRIYEKVNEIKARVKKGYEITGYEKRLLESGKSHTRFEIQIRNPKKKLKEISESPESLASYYDRLEFFDFKENGDSGILQILYKYINRKFRDELEKYRNHSIVTEIKDKYVNEVKEWFEHKEPF